VVDEVKDVEVFLVDLLSIFNHMPEDSIEAVSRSQQSNLMLPQFTDIVAEDLPKFFIFVE
jgi:hypothetical protein